MNKFLAGTAIILSLAMINGRGMAQKTDYKATTYELFVGGKVNQWGSVIKKMEKDPNCQSDISKIELLGYYYGYIGHLLDIKDKDAASVMIEKADALLDYLEPKYPDNTLIMAYSANITGYKIAVSPIKATVLAKGMMSDTKKAISKSPNDATVNILTANIFFYMPDFIGGNTEKALKQYHKALDMFEEDESLRHNNWMYLQLLVTTGMVEEKLKHYETAKVLYQRVLKLYPNYVHIRDNRYPNLIKKMNQ